MKSVKFSQKIIFEKIENLTIDPQNQRIVIGDSVW